MKHFIFLFSFITFSSFAFGEEACKQIGFDDLSNDLGDVASTATKDCSDKTLSHEELCKCLSDAKFNDIKVSKRDKDNFHKKEFDQAIREKLAHAVRDQISNFTKFSNLLKTKDHIGNLIDESGPLCNIQTIATDIEAIKNSGGSSECPSPKGFMPARLSEIFGTMNPKEIPNKLKFETEGVDAKSCLSTRSYLDLRSNSGAAAKGFRTFIIDGGENIKDVVKSSSPVEKEAYKDLLSYDVFFNLAYRDPEFQKNLNENMARIKKDGGKTFDIYNDPSTLKEAFKSLNRSCNQLMKNVKGFLCANDHPKITPATIARDHLDDYLAKKKLPNDEKDALRDYLTNRYSCQERTATVYRRTVAQVIRGEDKVKINESLEEKEFNEYIGNVVLLKTTTESFDKEDPKSDINVFNNMFCNGFEGKEATTEDLPKMMANYLQSLKDQGKDISKILEDENLQRKLGLKITTNPVTFSLLDEEDIKEGKLPKINQFKWISSMGEALKKAGLSEEETGQLYAIIEMQTNRKFSEIDDLKTKLVADNPNLRHVTASDLEAVAVRRDPDAIKRVQASIEGSTMGPLIPSQADAIKPENIESLITSRYQAHQTDSQKKDDIAQALLRGETTVAEVKEQAAAYNNNQGTYDPRFPKQEKDVIAGPSLPKEIPRPPPSSAPPTEPSEPSKTVADSSSPQTTSSRSPASSSSNSEISAPPIIAPSSGLADYNQDDSHNRDSSNSSNSGWKSKTDKSYNPDDDQYIKDIQKKIKETESRISEMSKAEDFYNNQIESLKKPRANNSRNEGNETTERYQMASNNIDPEYNYPKNVPISDGKGNHFYPRTDINGELSSANPNDDTYAIPEGELSSSGAGKGPGGTGASGGAGASAGPGESGGGSIGSLAGIGKDLPTGSGGSSKESEEEAQKRLALPAYEFPKYIPHALVEMVGSADKVVLIMGLEGKKWKTIEALQKFEESNSAKPTVTYNIRTYDFVPEGEFEDMKEDFVSKETREETFKKYFGFPRTKENMIVSKKYAQGTKEISKQEFPHSYILQIQNEIMKESELKLAIQSVSEKLK